MTTLATIETALEALRDGKMIILIDDEHRENEGDLVIAAEKATPETINFMAQYGRGLICMPAASDILDRLNLPMMVKHNKSKQRTPFTVSIGAAEGITTGISAFDRAHTIKVAIDSASKPEDIVSPGHIFPLKAKEGGILARAGHTEGAVDLARLAGFKPAAVLCEIMKSDGTMARLSDLIPFATRHGLPLISIADLITYRVNHEDLLSEVATAHLPLYSYGSFIVKVFESKLDKAQHVALISQKPLADHCLVRLHSECLTGDIFGSSRCDCGQQLEASLKRIHQEGGVLLYMRQEGRGIGLGNKIRAYALQETAGLDTVEANHALGFASDERDYGMGAQLLRHLGICKIRLLTNNPKKIAGLRRYGIEEVIREPLEIEPSDTNIAYLTTKRDKLGHLLSLRVNE